MAVEPDGRGFAQTSTSGLRGRKLFLWGSGPAGSRWQEWLCGPGARYAEIQAGWCPTQLEHDRLAAGASVSWTEAFGGVDLEPEAVAGGYAEASAAARGSRAPGDGPRRAGGLPRALAHRGGRRSGRRAAEHRVRAGATSSSGSAADRTSYRPEPCRSQPSTTTASRLATCSTVTRGTRRIRRPPAGAPGLRPLARCPRGGARLRVGAPGPRGECPRAGRTPAVPPSSTTRAWPRARTRGRCEGWRCWLTMIARATSTRGRGSSDRTAAASPWSSSSGCSPPDRPGDCLARDRGPGAGAARPRPDPVAGGPGAAGPGRARSAWTAILGSLVVEDLAEGDTVLG